MKSRARMRWLAFACCAAGCAAAAVQRERPVTKVVKLLEEMLAKSKTDADSDRDMFAKFKCYCDQEKESKTQTLKDVSGEIAALEAAIEEMKGATGLFSTECAELKASISENEQARAKMKEIRDEEASEFAALEADLVASISSMKEAVKTLSEVGADQSSGASAADHDKFMGGQKAFAQLTVGQQARVRAALAQARALAAPATKRRLAGFLQAPFTGSYTAQSGEVVGILKSMGDTFSQNLEAARTTEAAAQTAHDKVLAVKLAEHSKMTGLYDEKQASLSTNDQDLATKTGLLKIGKDTKSTTETFLGELVPMCSKKADEYAKRKALRANEDAAISEAMSILNSDASFDTFGKVSATSGGAAFLQRQAVRQHHPAVEQADQRRDRAAAVLRGSLRLSAIAASLQVGNPFKSVLSEIGKMKAVLNDEGDADSKKRKWCRSERTSQSAALEDKQEEGTELKAAIAALERSIDAPDTGLKATIASSETRLAENGKNAKEATEMRKEENAAYQQNAADLQEATELLSRAIKVMKDYYESFAQVKEQQSSARVLSGETDAVPDIWADGADSKADTKSDKSGDAISMLEFILDETQKESSQADADETAAQKAFDDQQETFAKEAETLKTDLVSLQSDLATAEDNLSQKTKDLAATTTDATAIQAYLESIKGGCDFIEENFDGRKGRREAEFQALEKAEGLLKATPAFQVAAASEAL